MRIRTRSFIIMFSQGLSQAATIALGIVLVRLITKEDLGTYRQVFLAYVLMAGLLSLQFGNSLYYYLPKLGLDQRRSLMAQTLLGTLLLALGTSAVMFLAAEPVAEAFKNADLAPLIRGFALYPFIDRLSELIPPFFISLDRPARAGVYSVALAISKSAVVIVAFALGWGLSGALWATVIAQGAVTAVGCLAMIRLCPSGSWRLDRKLILDQFHYTWPLWTTVVVAMLSGQFDRLLISVFFDPEVYAVYSSGAMELPVVSLVTMSVFTAIMPNLVVLANEGRAADALALWQEAIRKCSLVIFPSFVFFTVVSRDFIVFLYGEDYVMAAWPFAIYLLILPLRVAVFVVLLRAIGKTGPIAIGAAIGLVGNILLSTTVTLIGRDSLLGYLGPSLGAVFAVVLVAAYFIRTLCKLLSVPTTRILRWKELATILLPSLICGLVVFLAPLSDLVLPVRLAVQAAAFGVLLLALLHTSRLLTPDELQLLHAPAGLLTGSWLRRAPGAGPPPPTDIGPPAGIPEDPRQ